MLDTKSLVKQFAILSIAGQASIAQGNPQGTIDRQRPVMTSYNATGWLSDHTDPRFWFWNIFQIWKTTVHTLPQTIVIQGLDAGRISISVRTRTTSMLI